MDFLSERCSPGLLQVFLIWSRDTLRSSWFINTPTFTRTLSSRFKSGNLSCNFAAFSQVASSIGRRFHLTKLSSKKNPPFLIQRVSMISSGSIMKAPSSLRGGKVGQLALESPIFFFNKET